MKSERDLVAKYNELHQLIDRMGKTLLELMRHPEATNEQIDEARLKYYLCYAAWVDARIELRRRYPGEPVTQLEFPWNMKEA
jgi:hypothetical protein